MTKLRGLLPKRVPEWPWLLFWLAVLGLVLTAIFAVRGRPTLDWLPGVPTEQGASRERFDEAFWPALYSGIGAGVVTGLVTGIVVGGFLLVAERQLEARHRLREQRDALRRFRNHVIVLARDSEMTEKVPVRAVETLPHNAVEIDNLYSESPVLDWLKVAPNGDSFFPRLMSFSFAAKEFRQEAKKLDSILEQKVRSSDVSAVHPVYDYFADVMIQYYLAKILGRDMAKALLFIQPSGIHTGGLERTYLKLSEDDEVQEATAAYLSAATRLKDSVIGLAGEPTSLPW
jgi:hypothetical protein